MTNENYNQAQNKKYKVLLVEDIFFKDKADIPSIIGGLEKEIAGKTKHKIDLELTPRIDRALQNISTKDYDLVVTDIGLLSNIDSNRTFGGAYKTWDEIIQEVVSENTRNYLERKEAIEKEWAKICEKGVPMQSRENWKFDSLEFCMYVDWGKDLSGKIAELRESDSERLGTYIAKIAKQKFPTVIHTAKSHFGESVLPLYVYEHATLDEIANLLKNSQNFEPDAEEIKREGIIYTSPKKSLDHFSCVIDDAIENFI